MICYAYADESISVVTRVMIIQQSQKRAIRLFFSGCIDTSITLLYLLFYKKQFLYTHPK